MRESLKKLDIVGYVLVLGTWVVYSINSVWSVYMTVVLVLGAVLVVAALLTRWDQIRSSLGRRSTRFGLNSVTSVVLLIGVLGFVNYLGSANQMRFDLTTSQLFSLSDQSVAVTDQIVEETHIRAFYPGGDDPGVRSLLELYADRSSLLTYEFIDPDREPQLAGQFDVTVYGTVGNPLTGQETAFGTVILEMAGLRERIENPSQTLQEQDVTNALMKLVRGETKTVYFIEGHGERRIDDAERTGLQAARGALERENYVVESLNLAAADSVPEDASVLIWAGPEVAPFEGEIDLVDSYLNEGGSVLAMVDPPPFASLTELLTRWSVAAGNDFVIDASGLGRLLGAGPEIPLVSQYGSHVITDRFSLMTFFPLARSVTEAGTPTEGMSVTELLATGETSWAETDLESTEAGFDEGVDMEGPVTIGLAIEKDLDGDEVARLIVIGDSDFASNAYFGSQGNGDLFLNSVSWLAEDESFIAIRPKQPDDRPLNLTQSQGRISFYISLVFLPLSILVVGISVWMRRRGQ